MKPKTSCTRLAYIDLEILRLTRQGTSQSIALDMAKEHAAILDDVVEWGISPVPAVINAFKIYMEED